MTYMTVKCVHEECVRVPKAGMTFFFGSIDEKGLKNKEYRSLRLGDFAISLPETLTVTQKYITSNRTGLFLNHV